jgi:ParB/RepB/Spo0J family partition protein
MPDQLQLVPDERPEPTLRMIPVGRLVYDTMPFDQRFADSIARSGILQSIAVVQSRGRAPMYTVADGRRRVGAAQQAGIPEVPALVFPAGTPRHVAAAIALAANVQRSSNPVSELRSIQEMIAAGASEQDIAAQLRIPVGSIRARMRLAALHETLLHATEIGRIAPSIATQIARLPASRQERLATLYEERIRSEVAATGPLARITASDVHEVREAQRTEATEALPDDLFNDTPGEVVSVDPAQSFSDGTVAVTSDGETYALDSMDRAAGSTSPLRTTTPPDALVIVPTNAVGEYVLDVAEPGQERWFYTQEYVNEERERATREAVLQHAADGAVVIAPSAIDDYGIFVSADNQRFCTQEYLNQRVSEMENMLNALPLPANAADNELSDRERWASVARVMETGMTYIPVVPDDDSDGFIAVCELLLQRAREYAARG